MSEERGEALALAPDARLATGEVLPLDRHPAAVYLAGLGSDNSRRAMRTALREIAALASGGRLDELAFPWWRLRYQHTQAIRAALAARHAPATANLGLAALRGVLKEAWRLGLMSAEEYHRAVDLRPVKGEKVSRGRALSTGEIGALFRACAAAGVAGARDAALLALVFGCGLRRAEVVTLDVSDYRPPAGDEETAELIVRGKGRKERRLYLGNGARDAVQDWLNVRGAEPGPLLCPVRKDGQITLRRMTDQAVYLALDRRREQAGVAPFSPHDGRRSFISALWDAGVDGATIQALAGHASVTTTAKYDRRGERAKRRAVGAIHVPYRRG